MARIVCVLYHDPVDGYPSAHAQDDIPTLERPVEDGIEAEEPSQPPEQDQAEEEA